MYIQSLLDIPIAPSVEEKGELEPKHNRRGEDPKKPPLPKKGGGLGGEMSKSFISFSL